MREDEFRERLLRTLGEVDGLLVMLREWTGVRR